MEKLIYFINLMKDVYKFSMSQSNYSFQIKYGTRSNINFLINCR